LDSAFFKHAYQDIVIYALKIFRYVAFKIPKPAALFRSIRAAHEFMHAAYREIRSFADSGRRIVVNQSGL
jgi:hypothetical protein